MSQTDQDKHGRARGRVGEEGRRSPKEATRVHETRELAWRLRAGAQTKEEEHRGCSTGRLRPVLEDDLLVPPGVDTTRAGGC